MSTPSQLELCSQLSCLQAGLSQSLRSVPWFDNVDPDTFYPRCYNLGNAEEKDAFVGECGCLNYSNLVAAILLLTFYALFHRCC